MHCYEDKFRPYVRNALGDVVGQTMQNWPRVLENLPEAMTYLDLEQPIPGGGWQERRGRIILSGGEVLIDAIREPALYPLLEALRERYAERGGVNVVVQTTGDLLTEQIIHELVERGVWMISVAGMDDFHVGLEGAKRDPLQARLIDWFEAAGMQRSGLQHQTRNGMRRRGRSSPSSARRPTPGSESSGRAAGPGRTASRPRPWPTISAIAGRGAWAS